MPAQDAPFRRASNKVYSEWDQESSWRFFSLSSLKDRILGHVIVPGGDPPSFPHHGAGAARLNKKLKEKAVKKLERVAAREQMLLPYKLVGDYAWPAAPYKCPVFIPHHDPLCLSYGPASGQFCPPLPYIYSNQASAGDLFMYMIQSQSEYPPSVLTCSMAENLTQQVLCVTTVSSSFP